jgi:hypothetical protein
VASDVAAALGEREAETAETLVNEDILGKTETDVKQNRG